MEATHDSLSSTGLEWENLALYTSKPLHHQFGFSSAPNDSSHEAAGGSTTTARVEDHFGKQLGYDDSMRMPDPIIGLRLGHLKQEYANSSSSSSSSSSIPVSSTPTKRSRASYHNMQNPCCQVEGCNLDLKLAKDYHRRHRICESHSKSPKVIVAGLERRFCQQCSRFHDLSEFDDKKRSCRRRLSDHNARRRRVQPESIQLSSAGIISPLYTDQRQQQNVLLNGLPVSMPNSSWENANSRHAFVRPSKTTLNDDVLHMDPDRLSSLHRSTPRILDHCLHLPSSNCSMAPELLASHSLLSSNSWSMNEGESTSMEGISYSPVMRHSDQSDSHSLSTSHVFQSNNMINGVDPPPYMQNAASNSHHQEYNLFKPPNYHSGNFYSSQRSL